MICCKIKIIIIIKSIFYMIKRLLSFILPMKIYESESKISQSFEVTWNNGKLVLDSKNTNYSYGSLQKILYYAF